MCPVYQKEIEELFKEIEMLKKQLERAKMSGVKLELLESYQSELQMANNRVKKLLAYLGDMVGLIKLLQQIKNDTGKATTFSDKLAKQKLVGLNEKLQKLDLDGKEKALQILYQDNQMSGYMEKDLNQKLDMVGKTEQDDDKN